MLSEHNTLPSLEGSIAQLQFFVSSAERELSAFVEAVGIQFGVHQAYRSALVWIEEIGSIPWPVDGSTPDWRRATLNATMRLAKSMPGSSAIATAHRMTGKALDIVLDRR